METAKRVINELEINTPGTETAVRKLSGGNVQKVLVGREIESSPTVIVTVKHTVETYLKTQIKCATFVLFFTAKIQPMQKITLTISAK